MNLSLESASYGETEVALGEINASDKRLLVQFYIGAVQDMNETKKAQRPIFKDVECVRIMVPGDKNTIIDRPAIPQDIKRFNDHYEAFKKGNQSQNIGTPLSMWPLLSRSQIEELKHFNCHTVEQLAEMADTYIQNIPSGTSLKQKAKQFLDSAERQSETEKLRSELESATKGYEALKVQMAELLKAKENSLKPKEDSKEKKIITDISNAEPKKRGRPRKIILQEA